MSHIKIKFCQCTRIVGNNILHEWRTTPNTAFASVLVLLDCLTFLLSVLIVYQNLDCIRIHPVVHWKQAKTLCGHH